MVVINNALAKHYNSPYIMLMNVNMFLGATCENNMGHQKIIAFLPLLLVIYKRLAKFDNVSG